MANGLSALAGDSATATLETKAAPMATLSGLIQEFFRFLVDMFDHPPINYAGEPAK